MNIEKLASDRAKYKLGNLWNQKIEACDSEKTYIVTADNVGSVQERGWNPVQYRQDLQQILEIDPTLKIPCVPHDNVCSEKGKFRFCKQRSRGDLNIGMLDSAYLFLPNMHMDYDSTPFAEKKPIVFWRGAQTGGVNRWNQERLLEQGHTNDQILTISNRRKATVEYFEKNPNKNIDIKFEPKYTQREYMTKVYNDYKYMMYLEGNDVGSNIWWTYKVNCVTLCPEILKSECVFDLYIKPWEHYVPVDPFDFNDIIEKVRWCEENTEKCINIIKQANHVYAMVQNPEIRYETNKLIAEKIKDNLIIKT